MEIIRKIFMYGVRIMKVFYNNECNVNKLVDFLAIFTGNHYKREIAVFLLMACGV